MIVDFHSLYERYAQDVYRFVVYLSGDPVLAEDITAETFVRAWVTPEEIRVGTVKAYLFTIARNLYRAGLKRTARQVDLTDHFPDPAPDPEAASTVRWELNTVLQTLQTLPEVDRAILLMHVQDDMSYAEIATVFDLSVAAVKVRVHRSRIELHRLISQEKNSHENHS